MCSVEGDSNALIMPAKKSNKRKGMNQVCSAIEIVLLFCYALSFKGLMPEIFVAQEQEVAGKNKNLKLILVIELN